MRECGQGCVDSSVWTGVCVDPLQCSPMCLVYECMCSMGTVCVVAAAELFNNREQHDAHEFLNYLVNTVDDLLRKPRPKGGASLWVEVLLSPVTCRSHHCPSPPTHTDAPEAYAGQDKRTWVDDVFKGTLTNETKCLCCETVSHVTVT